MKRENASRPKLPKISEAMKAWSAALGAEVTGWPQVTMRVFFGFTALYRRDKIFAVLPRTRAMETPNSLAFKFESPSSQIRARLEREARIGTTSMQKARWFTFELSTDADLHDTLDWLEQAYEAAGRRPGKRRKDS
jgi:predicted DNA-binding protein (MmcQ/YjbR family)